MGVEATREVLFWLGLLWSLRCAINDLLTFSRFLRSLDITIKSYDILIPGSVFWNDVFCDTVTQDDVMSRITLTLAMPTAGPLRLAAFN